MTFLFDIGRVLLDFDFEKSLQRLLPDGVSDAHQRIARLIERKDEFESGQLDADSYTIWALEVLQSRATPEEFHFAWRDIFTRNEPMWECVRKLAGGGHRLILFSNINALHSPWIYQEYPDFSLFHGAVMSFETGFIKPNPKIYEYATSAYGLVPSETLYIDDLEANIATGKEMGFRSWQYDLRSHDSFLTWLEEQMRELKAGA